MGSWFRDYIFMPISVTRPMMKLNKAMAGKFGNMVTLKGNEMSYDSLNNVIGQKTKNVNPDGELVRFAKNIGISFGD